MLDRAQRRRTYQVAVQLLIGGPSTCRPRVRLHYGGLERPVGISFYDVHAAHRGALRRRSCRKTCYFCGRSFEPCSSAMTTRSARRRWCAAAPATRSRSTPRALQPSTVAEEHRQLLRLQLRQLARRFEGPSCPWRGKSGRRASTARGAPPACCSRGRVQKELLPTPLSLCALPACPGRHTQAGSGSLPELHRLFRGSSPRVSRRAWSG